MNLDSLKNAIKSNPALAASLAALLLACLALAFAQGCDMRRMVRVDAPKDLLSAVDVPDAGEGIDRVALIGPPLMRDGAW